MLDDSLALEAQQLCVTRGAKAVLDHVSLRVPWACVHALVGPNGAGKSTLLKALVGIVPARGTLRVAGRDVAELDVAARARLVGYVPQQTLLSSGLSVRDVVAQGRYAERARWFGLAHDGGAEVQGALDACQLQALRDRPFNRLSGGEQRRVLIARALATGARVLLLDEPTAGLDVAHVLHLFALLRSLTTRGYTALVVLHDLADVLGYADHATLLCAGKVVAQGGVKAVVAPAPVLEAYGVVLGERSAPGYSLRGASP